MNGLGISHLDLNKRASRFEAHSSKLSEREQRKAEKQKLVLERAQARKQAHLDAVAELRRRQVEEAEKVCSRFAKVSIFRGVAMSHACLREQLVLLQLLLGLATTYLERYKDFEICLKCKRPQDQRFGGS
jgi:hypothetical protein